MGDELSSLACEAYCIYCSLSVHGHKMHPSVQLLTAPLPSTSFHARVSDSVQTLSIYCCILIPVLARKGKISGWKSATDPISTLETKYTHQSSGNEIKPVRRIIRKTNGGSRIQGDARTTAEG